MQLTPLCLEGKTFVSHCDTSIAIKKVFFNPIRQPSGATEVQLHFNGLGLGSHRNHPPPNEARYFTSNLHRSHEQPGTQHLQRNSTNPLKSLMSANETIRVFFFYLSESYLLFFLNHGCHSIVVKVFDSYAQGRGFNPLSRHGGVGQTFL